MLRCSPEAFAKCPTHQYCGNYPSECTFAEGSDCDKFNQQVDNAPKTPPKGEIMNEEAI